MGKLTDKVAKGVFWILLEKLGVQTVHFVVTLILARLLTPDDYGTVALLSVFIGISDLLLDCGICSALVRKKNATPTDYNTVFYINFGLSLAFYGILFLGAPLVARFYSMPVLSPLLRLLGLQVVFHGLNDIQEVELKRKMWFKLSFRISWAQCVVAAAVGIVLAMRGYGPWALAWSSVAGGFVGMIARQLVIRWHPQLLFSWASARELFGFGWKLAAARFLTSLNGNLISLCIGKMYARADLAFFKKGSHIPKLVMSTVQQALGRSSFPALSRLQDDPARMRRAMRRMIRVSTFLTFPLLAGCALLAEPLIVVLFGAKWLPAVPFVRLTCLALTFRPFDTINFQALNARGRSDIYLKLMVFRRLLGLVILVVMLPFGIIPFVVTSAIVFGPLCVAINAWPNRRELGYTIGMQLRDVAPSFALTALACAAAAALFLIPCPRLPLLVLQLAVGAAVYLVLAVWVRSEPLMDVGSVMVPIVGRRSPFLGRVLERLVGKGARGR